MPSRVELSTHFLEHHRLEAKNQKTQKGRAFERGYIGSLKGIYLVVVREIL